MTKVFREVFADDSIVLRDDLTANDVDGWDSLSYVNLIIAIELEFGIEFKQKEIQKFSNVGELINSIQSKTVNLEK